MRKISLLILAIISFSCLGLNKGLIINKTPTTLKDTNWTSQFYHYCNNYHFDTDSTGYSEDGQVAWSAPMDPKELEFGENEVIYMTLEKFKYDIEDTILTIQYLNWHPHDTIYQRVFYYNNEDTVWISEYEYAYGKEYLLAGNRKRRFEE